MFTVDTLEFSRDLEKVGMQRQVAETLAEKIKQAQDISLDKLATKADLKAVENDLRSQIKISMLTTIVSLGAIMAFIQKFLG